MAKEAVKKHAGKVTDAGMLEYTTAIRSDRDLASIFRQNGASMHCIDSRQWSYCVRSLAIASRNGTLRFACESIGSDRADAFSLLPLSNSFFDGSILNTVVPKDNNLEHHEGLNYVSTAYIVH